MGFLLLILGITNCFYGIHFKEFTFYFIGFIGSFFTIILLSTIFYIDTYNLLLEEEYERLILF